MLEKEHPLAGPVSKRPALFRVVIAVGVVLMLSAGISFFLEAKEGTCVERGVACGFSWPTTFFIGDGLVLAGMIGVIVSRRRRMAGDLLSNSRLQRTPAAQARLGTAEPQGR